MPPLTALARQLRGTLHTDHTLRILYATDASAYRQLPLAVALPKDEGDIEALIQFARQHNCSLIPRAAGTSLAGQVVGEGIVVDISKHFNQILELNTDENWVRVQPGVIRDELNHFLKEHGRFFGPETSTANRAMIGGMVGNNSCGSNSVVYGSTRDHLLEVQGFLSDGSKVCFKSLSAEEFEQKCQLDTLEGKIYREIYAELAPPEVRQAIAAAFPKPDIPRRNTGYALDLLTQNGIFDPEHPEKFNFCKLIAGSEGTLCFLTEIKLGVSPLPPPVKGLLCGHFTSIDAALRANLVALRYAPSACELMDHYVLDCTKNSREHAQNRFFVEGDPKAILVVEIARQTEAEVRHVAERLTADLQAESLGYHFPLVMGSERIKQVWNLRKAGLGLLSNMPGDAKPAPVIEDTAVAVEDLPEYIAEFNEILAKYNQFCVHYAHAGSGELHLRPILNLKTSEGQRMFRVIAEEIAALVKKYQGSLSGEHGDGRLRGEFIQFMVGEENYQRMRRVKQIFDPQGVFNPNKIVDTPPMDTSLRYTAEQETRQFKTTLNFDDAQGILRMAEMCNGSGDCRKTELTGGTMCPSYMATRREKDTTRARANILREILTQSDKKNPFDSPEIKEVMDLCLSCKGCKSECPSNVDVGKMKAEFLSQYYAANGVPLRSRLIGNFSRISALASLVPSVYNFTIQQPFLSRLIKKTTGFATERSLPALHATTLRRWLKRHQPSGTLPRAVYLFVDEFTNYNDTPIGIKAVELLEHLGYRVLTVPHPESGRAFLSKGMLKEARSLAIENVRIFQPLINDQTPLIGIEPSAILSFRDEYPDLVPASLRPDAQALAKHTLLIDEFLAQERDKGHIGPEQFSDRERVIKLHGHCHQKALSSLTATKKMLTLPRNYAVHLIRSGCCGMAGSFGYEAEHFAVSQQIGELVLFPAVRQQPETVSIAAPGTSCRHQIKDGTGRTAWHPVELLWEGVKY